MSRTMKTPSDHLLFGLAGGTDAAGCETVAVGTTPSACPHLRQNCESSGVSVPHLTQNMIIRPCSAKCSSALELRQLLAYIPLGILPGIDTREILSAVKSEIVSRSTRPKLKPCPTQNLFMKPVLDSVLHSLGPYTPFPSTVKPEPFPRA